MPPLEAGPTTPCQWAVLVALGLGVVWALIAVPALRWAAVLMVIVSVIFNEIIGVRLRRLARTRSDDIGTFARSLDVRNTDTWLIRAVYEEVNALLPSKLRPFPLRSTDTCEILHIDPEDLDDLVEIVAERAGYSLEQLEDNPHYGSVRTLGELIRCLQAQPRIPGGRGAWREERRSAEGA